MGEYFLNFLGIAVVVLIVAGILRGVFKTSAKFIEDNSVKKQGGLHFLALPLLTILDESFKVEFVKENGSVIEFVLKEKDDVWKKYLPEPEFIKVKVQLIQSTFFIEYWIFSGYYLNRERQKHLYTSPRYNFEHGLNDQDQVGRDLTIHIMRQKIVIHEARMEMLKSYTSEL